jgi:5'(3')-deoxyribonucleotidase
MSEQTDDYPACDCGSSWHYYDCAFAQAVRATPGVAMICLPWSKDPEKRENEMGGLNWYQEKQLRSAALQKRVMDQPQPIIAIDVDSVLFPINERVILPALHAAGLPTQLREITDFDYAACLSENHKQVAYDQFRRSDLYDGHMPPDSAMEALKILRRNNHVIAVSSPFAGHATSKWRFCQRAGFKHEDIVLCGDKGLVRFDVLLDDRPSTLEEIGPSHAVVFDRPWNRTDGLMGYPYERAYGWDDVVRKVARLL